MVKFFLGFLSMWISNTATTAMMIPIVDAIAQVSVEGQDPDEDLDDAANKEEAPLASQDPSNADTGEKYLISFR